MGKKQSPNIETKNITAKTVQVESMQIAEAKEEEIKKKDIFADLIVLSTKVDLMTDVNKKTVMKFQWLAIVLIILAVANIALQVLLILK